MLLLLGQRPYNDDTLLLDSMTFEDESFEDVVNDECDALKFNSTQTGEQVDQYNTNEVDIEIIKSPTQENLRNTTVISNIISTPKRDVVTKLSSSTTKTVIKNKKKSSDPK